MAKYPEWIEKLTPNFIDVDVPWMKENRQLILLMGGTLNERKLTSNFIDGRYPEWNKIDV